MRHSNLWFKFIRDVLTPAIANAWKKVTIRFNENYEINQLFPRLYE